MMNLKRRRSRRGMMLEADEILADSMSVLDPGDHLERKIEHPLGHGVSFLFLTIIMVGVGYLGIRSFALQVVSGGEFLSESEKNRFSVRSIFAPRGAVYDRLGISLVDNSPSFGLVFDGLLFRKSDGDENTLLRELEAIFAESESILFEIKQNLSAADALPASSRVIIARNIPPELVVAISSRLDVLPGVQIFESYRRVYRDPRAFSHVLGFVGSVSPEDIAKRPELADEETAGKSGIEGFYDGLLRGVDGKKVVEVDSRGSATRYKLAQEAILGNTLTLSIDGSLQSAIYDLVSRYTMGAKGASVVAVDPRSGAVRALVSFPGFDINSFGHSLSSDAFNAILENPLRPLFNRAISGEFPSGSTVKPLLAAAALQEGIIDPRKKIYDEGFIAIPNPYRPGERSVFPDWKKHGWVDMYDAIAQSANVYFYMIGGGYRDMQGLGIERIKRYEAAFGFGALTGIDIFGERPGLVPDPEWKKEAHPEDPMWRIGDTYNTSIGQGGTKVTSLQMAMALSALANGGTLWRPYILESARNSDGRIVADTDPTVIRRGIIRQEVLKEVVLGMRQTVTSGTARLLQEVPMDVAAKTGTAQSVPGKLPHAWVTAFAPFENPEIAIVVMVEYAGEGSTVAVPITNEILKWYASHRHGEHAVQNPD